MCEAPVARLTEVTHRYGSTVALDCISLQLPRGTVGLVGNNGAGKSTLLKILLGMLRPSQGQVEVFGVQLHQAASTLRRRFGYMAEADAVLPLLQGVEYVALSGQLYGMSRRQSFRRAHEVLGYVGLGELRYRPVEQYSRGNLQRLKLAAALVHDPDVLLLDEPTNGLDPPGRDAMLRLLEDLIAQGQKSVVLCTHLLGDVQRLCEHVVILARGRVVYQGPLAPLLQLRTDQYLVRWQGSQEWLHHLRCQGVQITPGANGSQALLGLPSGWSTQRLFQVAQQHGAILHTLRPVEEDLQSVFLRLSEKANSDPKAEA